MQLNLDPNQLIKFLTSRRTIRRFNSQPISKDILQRVIETAVWAPNAHNRQPWRFIALTSQTAKNSLAEAMAVDFKTVLEAEGLEPGEIENQITRSQTRINQAPAAILLCMDENAIDPYEDENRQKGERLMAVQSVAMAGGYLLLAAHALGLGGVWMCAPLFAPESVRQSLELPESWQAQGLILLGYPEKIPQLRPRLSSEEVIIFK